jgi:opacity protein-like surface antigen
LFKNATLALIVFGALIAATPSPAQAQDGSGPYVTVGGGYQHRLRAAENAQTYTDFNDGFALNGAAGYEFGHLGIEGEYSYLRNTDKTTAAAVTGPQNGLGNVTLSFVMANFRYEIPAGRLRPYVGAGIGGYKSTLHGISNVVAKSFGLEANGTNDGVPFAFQVRAGLDFAISNRSGVLIGYRYLHGGDLLFLGTQFGDLRPDGVKVHSLEGAIKIGF